MYVPAWKFTYNLLHLRKQLKQISVQEANYDNRQSRKRWQRRRSDFYLIFTEILCSTNCCTWSGFKLTFITLVQIGLLSIDILFETHLTSNSKIVNVRYDFSPHGKKLRKIQTTTDPPSLA